MEELRLVRPSEEHRSQYEAMMDEWESFGGRLNPGALRRYSNKRQKNVSYEEWLEWIEEDRSNIQDMYFLTKGNHVIGAISIRFKRTLQDAGTDGHSGYGIRPSERRKGYATIMLSLALPIMKEYGINPVVITCAKENVGSAKTIIKNGGKLMKEVIDPDNGELVQIYYIDL